MQPGSAVSNSIPNTPKPKLRFSKPSHSGRSVMLTQCTFPRTTSMHTARYTAHSYEGRRTILAPLKNTRDSTPRPQYILEEKVFIRCGNLSGGKNPQTLESHRPGLTLNIYGKEVNRQEPPACVLCIHYPSPTSSTYSCWHLPHIQ